jgi:hypothetical protein
VLGGHHRVRGYHFYFNLTDTVSVKSGLIWGLWDTMGDTGKGGWVKHKEVRILGDNSLAIAPPSVHVGTGRHYRFDGRQNPNRIKFPAPPPRWLLDMPRLTTPRFGEPAPTRSTYMPRVGLAGRFYTRDEVLIAVGGAKFDIATKEWGLVAVVKEPNPSGWVCCFVPWRENPKHSRPSGSFHWSDGTFQDRKTMETMAFFDLGVALGKFHDWKECRDHLGDRFIGRVSQKP